MRSKVISCPPGVAPRGNSNAAFPAQLDAVWTYLRSPDRVPGWLPGIGTVQTDGANPPATEGSWPAAAPAHQPNGKALKIKPEYRRLRVALLGATDPTALAWSVSYPDAPRANTRLVEIELSPAAGGTHVALRHGWVRNPGRRSNRPVSFLLRPLHRLMLWMQVTQTGAGISRAFR